MVYRLSVLYLSHSLCFATHARFLTCSSEPLVPDWVDTHAPNESLTSAESSGDTRGHAAAWWLFVHCKVEALEHTQSSVVIRVPGTQMVVEQRLDASGRTTRITMDSGDDAVNALCSGPQLTSLKLWLCSETTTYSFADAEDDGVRPSVWMTSLAAPNIRVVLWETISVFSVWLISTADTGSASVSGAECHTCTWMVQQRIHCHWHEAEASCTLALTPCQSLCVSGVSQRNPCLRRVCFP